MMGNRKRNILKMVYIDDTEEKILFENMSRFGTRKFSTYARRMLLFPTVPIFNIKLTEIQEVKWELKRIGNNINQMSKLANQSKTVSPESLEILERCIAELSEELTKATHMKIEEIKNHYGSY